MEKLRVSWGYETCDLKITDQIARETFNVICDLKIECDSRNGNVKGN
jgi:hypothetical protein